MAPRGRRARPGAALLTLIYAIPLMILLVTIAHAAVTCLRRRPEDRQPYQDMPSSLPPDKEYMP